VARLYSCACAKGKGKGPYRYMAGDEYLLSSFNEVSRGLTSRHTVVTAMDLARQDNMYDGRALARAAARSIRLAASGGVYESVMAKISKINAVIISWKPGKTPRALCLLSLASLLSIDSVRVGRKWLNNIRQISEPVASK